MVELYPHQKEAVGKLQNGNILCGGVGSGKSRASLFYYTLKQGGDYGTDPVKKMDNPCDLYIITTARKRDTGEWEDELNAFWMSSIPDRNEYSNKIIIDSWNNIKKYTNVNSAFFIFDEQRVVGSGTWVKAFLKITRRNKWILLSATPGDTWIDYIPVFVANGFYRNKTEFIRDHVIYNSFSKFPKIDKFINVNKLNFFRRQILVDMKFKRDTVSHRIDIDVDYDRIAYKDLLKYRWNTSKDDAIQSASELCFELRKIVNTDPSRILSTVDIVEQRRKVIIFYNYNYEVDMLRTLPYGKDTIVAEWNGSKHEDIPNSDSWVYLVQYTAGAEGWNCISTDTIIFYSQNYSYKIMQQAAGRIDRLNTPYTDLYYYHMKSKAPIDLAIERALVHKKKFNESAFVFR